MFRRLVCLTASYAAFHRQWDVRSILSVACVRGRFARAAVNFVTFYGPLNDREMKRR